MTPAARTIVVAMNCIAVVHAAPSTTDTLDTAQPAEAHERALPDKLRAGEPQTGSRTIDLLIDLQQRNAGLQFNEKQRGSGSGEPKARPSSVSQGNATPSVPAQPAAAARADQPPTSPSGLFGSGATPAVQSARTTLPGHPAGGEPGAGPPRRSGGLSATGAPLPAWLLWPRDVIQYVRENRGFVLGSMAGGLLLIWGLSRLFARAAANTGLRQSPSGMPEARDDRISAGRWDPSPQEAHRSRHRSRRHSR